MRIQPVQSIKLELSLKIVKAYSKCYAFGYMVTIRGGYRVARGWHYTKLSLSCALILYFSGMCFVLLFLSFCRFSFCLCFCFNDLVGALCRCCSCDRFLPSRPRTGLATTYQVCIILLGMVESRSVNVKNTRGGCLDAFRFFSNNLNRR